MERIQGEVAGLSLRTPETQRRNLVVASYTLQVWQNLSRANLDFDSPSGTLEQGSGMPPRVSEL